MRTKNFIFLITFFVSSLVYGYETEWNDPKLGTSLFKVHGYWWFGYEKMDSQKGVHDTGTKQGFTSNRVYVRFDGSVKEGDWKDFKYHITLEGAPGTDVFVKYAYFEHALPLNFVLRYGLQSTPTVNGGKNTNLENLWAHRYLDGDGKAIWDQIGVSTSSDLGIGLEQNTDLYNFLIVVANGEGYKKKNGESISNTSLSSLSEGSGSSYGYHVYGRFSITPLTAKKDVPTQIHISFPFQLENKFGIQRDEYEYIDKLDFLNRKVTLFKGNPRAKQDVAFGVELDAILKMNENKLGFGIGGLQKINRKSDALKVDESLLAGSVSLGNFYKSYYVPGSDAKGLARYIFAYFNTKTWGIVTRYYEHTTDNSFSTSLKSSEQVPVLNQLLVEDIKDNGVIGDLSAEKIFTKIRDGSVDSGKAKLRSLLFAFEYFVNKSWKFAVGITESKATIKSGERYKINPFKANNISQKSSSNPYGYTTNNFANYVSTQISAPSGLLTDNDLVGTNKLDRQIFFRSQFTW